MSPPPPHTWNSRKNRVPKDLIALAAKMRAEGKSWDDIAVVVGRRPDTVRRWEWWFSVEFHQAAQDAAANNPGGDSRGSLNVPCPPADHDG